MFFRQREGTWSVFREFYFMANSILYIDRNTKLLDNTFDIATSRSDSLDPQRRNFIRLSRTYAVPCRNLNDAIAFVLLLQSR